MIEASGELSVRNDPVGGPVLQEVSERPKDWMLGAPRVVLLVHGFNNNQCEACEAFQDFFDLLPRGLAKFGRFFWPGDADFGFFQWVDFLSYPTEIPDAKESARVFAEHLLRFAKLSPHTELFLVGHSMGCRLILEMLYQIHVQKQPGTPMPRIALSRRRVL